MNQQVVNETAITVEILDLINEHRNSIGLTPLQSNTTAVELAISHSQYMINQQAISHDNFDQRAQVLQDQLNATGWAENVASRYGTAEGVVNGWLSSPGHKRNIEGNYTHTGIAAVKDANGYIYYTQLFYR
ncbi:cysteine-rich secretory family protein [Aquimarina brevivitae]|uniref:Cysteine-rich secretory family protein n=2 Tax=Aquimarina brevivitae TaxID=323412 RepID=A0A4Q7NYC0_9FLAO|nr:cysteine-rich secretory family protein [Aquimarina brevivitae]